MTDKWFADDGKYIFWWQPYIFPLLRESGYCNRQKQHLHHNLWETMTSQYIFQATFAGLFWNSRVMFGRLSCKCCLLTYANVIKSHLIALGVRLVASDYTSRIPESKSFSRDFYPRWQECQSTQDLPRPGPCSVTSAGIPGDLKYLPLPNRPLLSKPPVGGGNNLGEMHPIKNTVLPHLHLV